MVAKTSHYILLALALTASASAALVVDFTVSTATGLPHTARAADTENTLGDIWNFSETVPLFDLSGTGVSNARVYGGLRTSWDYNYPTDYDPTFQINTSGHIQLSVGPGGLPSTQTHTYKGLYIWKKADFLSGATVQLGLGAGDSISINISAHLPESAKRQVRYVVQQGANYYVSNTAATDTGAYSLSDFASETWAQLNTSTYTYGAFQSLALTDIGAVGLYVTGERVSGVGSPTGVTISDFQVYATPAGEIPKSQITLASIFTSGCVLQREQSVKIWGRATPGQTVTVQVKSQNVQAVVDASGKWLATLAPELAGGPHTVTISSPEVSNVVLTNVYFGDVWLLTGQSNMFQSLSNQMGAWGDYYSPNAPNASDDFANVRFCLVNTLDSADPVENVTMTGNSWHRWDTYSHSNLRFMSAVGYYFVRALRDAFDANGMGNVPIGVIRVCVGGTSIEQWMSPAALASVPEPLVLSGNPPLLSGLYRGMLEPIQKYAVKGALWYQGENNAGNLARIEQYPLLKKALIESWRAEWGINFPFYFVQLSPHRPFDPNPTDDTTWDWAWMRESQTECLEIPNTAMACIIDIGVQNNIHPPFKDIVGQRLATIALAKTYGFDLVARGPTVSKVEINGSTVTITFDNVADGLRTQAVDAMPDADEIAADRLPLSVSSNILAGFALCGANQTFYWATDAAIISPNQVQISNAKDVPSPVAVRYAWGSFPICNLFNSAGLPAEPFRTDTYLYGTSSGAGLTAPNLGLFRQGADFLLEWQPLPTGWILEATTDLANGVWTEVPGSRDHMNVHVSPKPAEFFRLRKAN